MNGQKSNDEKGWVNRERHQHERQVSRAGRGPQKTPQNLNYLITNKKQCNFSAIVGLIKLSTRCQIARGQQATFLIPDTSLFWSLPRLASTDRQRAI